MSLIGLDILGASGEKAVLVRVKNVPELVKQQAGGWEGSLGKFLAQGVLSDTIENKVYSEMQKQIAQAMKEKNVAADVSVVVASDYKSTSSQFLKHAAVGAGAVGLGWAVWHFGLSRLFR